MLEILKRSGTSKVETPKPETPPQPEYAKTMLGVLYKLSNRISAENLAEESTQATACLIKMFQEGVDALKRRETTQINTPFQVNQDGAYSFSNEGFKLEEDKYKVHTTYHHLAGEVVEDELLHIEANSDLTQILEAHFSHTKKFNGFSGETTVLKEIKISFENNLVKEVSTISTPDVPEGPGSYYIKPHGFSAQSHITFSPINNP